MLNIVPSGWENRTNVVRYTDGETADLLSSTTIKIIQLYSVTLERVYCSCLLPQRFKKDVESLIKRPSITEVRTWYPVESIHPKQYSGQLRI